MAPILSQLGVCPTNVTRFIGTLCIAATAVVFFAIMALILTVVDLLTVSALRLCTFLAGALLTGALSDNPSAALLHDS